LLALGVYVASVILSKSSKILKCDRATSVPKMRRRLSFDGSGPIRHRISAPSAGASQNNLDDIGGPFADKAALLPRESAPSGSPATALMTLPTVDRTHLGLRNALPIWRGTDDSNPSPSESANYRLPEHEELHYRAFISITSCSAPARAPLRERRRVPSSVFPEALSRFRRQRPGPRRYRWASPNRYNSLMKPG